MNGVPDDGQEHPEEEMSSECRPDAEEDKRATSITTTTMKKGDYSEKHPEPIPEEEPKEVEDSEENLD